MTIKQIDIAEAGSQIVDLSKLGTDDAVKFLEQIRLFYEDAKKHGKHCIKGCKENVIDGWLHQEDIARIVKGKEEKAVQIMSDFYDLVYEKYAPK